MNWRILITALGTASILVACQMPQPQGMPVPSGPSMPSGSSGPTGAPTPGGSPMPSGDPGSPSSGDPSSGDPSSGDPSAGDPSAGDPSAGSTSSAGDPSGMPGSPGSSGAESMPAGASTDGSAAGGIETGAPVPWPEQPGAGTEGGSVDDLDARLEESLGDFDESVMGGTEVPNDQGVDILDPMGSGSSGEMADQPIFEEGDLDDPTGGLAGGGENAEVAERAAAGGSQGGASGGAGAAPPGASSGGKGNGTGSGSQGSEQGGLDDIPVPADVGDGRNDDIVLRQIRDAAMHERDPVLREKLWDEYRRIQAQR